MRCCFGICGYAATITAFLGDGEDSAAKEEASRGLLSVLKMGNLKEVNAHGLVFSNHVRVVPLIACQRWFT